MTTSQIDDIYRKTPDYPHTDGFMTHGMSKAVWDEVHEYFASRGLCSINTQPKAVFSLLSLDNAILLRMSHNSSIFKKNT